MSSYYVLPMLKYYGTNFRSIFQVAIPFVVYINFILKNSILSYLWTHPYKYIMEPTSGLSFTKRFLFWINSIYTHTHISYIYICMHIYIYNICVYTAIYIYTTKYIYIYCIYIYIYMYMYLYIQYIYSNNIQCYI